MICFGGGSFSFETVQGKAGTIFAGAALALQLSAAVGHLQPAAVVGRLLQLAAAVGCLKHLAAVGCLLQLASAVSCLHSFRAAPCQLS